MLKGLALTPPVVGRIAIGRVVDKGGRRLPEKDDEFTLTSQVQGKDGWVLHPLDAQLRKDAQAKLRSIPVRLLFDDPDLSLRANYTMFERSTGRPLCVGDGQTCKRVTVAGMQSLPCPSPDSCALAQDGNCRPYGRLHVRVDVRGDVDGKSEADTGTGMGTTTEMNTGTDELGSFVFRTTGFNSIRTLSTRLRYLAAVSGGLVASLPLELRLRGKSTTLSHRTPIYFVDLTLRSGVTLAQAVALARQEREQLSALGLDQAALDEAARQGLALGEFEESAEEIGELGGVMEEFYPEPGAQYDDRSHGPEGGRAQEPRKSALRTKLARKLGAGSSATGDRGDGREVGHARA